MIKNDAINIALRYIGEAPLPDGTTLESLDSQHEANIINNILEEVSSNVQESGWWFNKEEWTFIPDSTTNKINIPSSVLYFYTTDGDYIVRGNVLYDRTNKTFTITTPVTANVVWKVDFETLPLKASNYITYLAAQEAQIFFSGDTAIDKDLQMKAKMAYVELQRTSLRYNKHNLISGSRLVARDSNPTGVS